MKVELKKPPRKFEVGFEKKGIIKDCGNLYLSKDEQITLLTEKGGEYDITRKSWGFYATPSTNARLTKFGLRAVLVKNRLDRYFVMIVEKGYEEEFEKYVFNEPLKIVIWLDDVNKLEKLNKGQ